jgi:hypothetical protein
MSLQVRTMFPATAGGLVCVLVDGSRRTIARGRAGALSSPRALTIVGDACIALRGADAIAEARRLRTRIRRATTSNE